MDARWKRPVRPCCVPSENHCYGQSPMRSEPTPLLTHPLTPYAPATLAPFQPLEQAKLSSTSEHLPVPGMVFLQVSEGLSPSLLPGISAEGSPLKGSCRQLYLNESTSWYIVCQVPHLFPSLYVTRWNCLVCSFPSLLFVSPSRTNSMSTVALILFFK